MITVEEAQRSLMGHVPLTEPAWAASAMLHRPTARTVRLNIRANTWRWAGIDA